MMSQGDQDGENGPITVTKDVEKGVGQSNAAESRGTLLKTIRRTLADLISAGPVEERGVMPVALEDRTATNYFSYFWIWASMNINLLP